VKTDKMVRIEYERGKSIESILRDEFGSGKSDRAIATALGISRTCLYDWLELLEADIQRTRKISFGREPVEA
jgi:hypothetical protein